MEIKKILLDINFAEKYITLSKKYPEKNDSLEKYSIEIVSNIIKGFGYNYTYFKSENFFRLFESFNNYNLWIHISLRYGLVDLMLYVKYKKELLFPCGSFNWIVSDIGLSGGKIISLPCFTNYEELEEILKEGLDIYKDFKDEFLRNLE